MEGAEADTEYACVMPMDGFHLTRAELDQMKDPKEAHARRGSEWTFDATKLAKCLADITEQTDSDIKIPGFDHKLKDPSPGQYVVSKKLLLLLDAFNITEHKIVLVEGLYLCLDNIRWAPVTSQFQIRCFLFTPMQVAEQRIVPRHVEAGIAKDENAALARWLENDKQNAEEILNHLDHEKLDIRIVTTAPG